MVWINVCVCVCVCVCWDAAVPQELDTPGLPYLARIHSSKVALTNIFSTILEAIKKGKKSASIGFLQSSCI